MASELHEKGYKDPAAVIAGSVLEEHLRKLATKHEIMVEKPSGEPKKADALNADLTREELYSKLEQKNVTAWRAAQQCRPRHVRRVRRLGRLTL
jgi:hypothetical protein